MAVSVEQFGTGHTALKVGSAIEPHSAEDSGIYPYERPLPDPDASIALTIASASAPMVRRPHRITIEGRR